MKPGMWTVCVLLGGIPIAVHAFENGPIDGQVVDAVTKQPVAGSVVLAQWIRSEGVIAESVEVCHHAAIAVSDARGRYHLDTWQHSNNPLEWLFSSSYSVRLDAYHAGMATVWPPTYKFDEMTGELKLTAWRGTPSQRVWWLRSLFNAAARDCDPPPVSAAGIDSLRAAILSEAKSIATADAADQKVVRTMEVMQDTLRARAVGGRTDVVPAVEAPPVVVKEVRLPPPNASPGTAK